MHLQLLPQDYHLRETKLFIRYSVVSADPADCPSFEGFAFYLRAAAGQPGAREYRTLAGHAIVSRSFRMSSSLIPTQVGIDLT